MRASVHDIGGPHGVNSLPFQASSPGATSSDAACGSAALAAEGGGADLSNSLLWLDDKAARIKQLALLSKLVCVKHGANAAVEFCNKHMPPHSHTRTVLLAKFEALAEAPDLAVAEEEKEEKDAVASAAAEAAREPAASPSAVDAAAAEGAAERVKQPAASPR